MQNITYSIIIPTYNRADSIRRTLLTLLSVDRSGISGVEAIVVDNNSTDHTRSVVTEIKESADLAVIYAFEPKQGPNHARNRGIDTAIGSILVFADDDVEFEARWLSGIQAAFLNAPDADCVTGKVIPVFEGGRPEWLTSELLAFYGAQDFGSTAEIRFPEFPGEANIALPRKVVEQHGRFQTAFNRDAKTLMSDDKKKFFSSF